MRGRHGCQRKTRTPAGRVMYKFTCRRRALYRMRPDVGDRFFLFVRSSIIVPPQTVYCSICAVGGCSGARLYDITSYLGIDERGLLNGRAGRFRGYCAVAAEPVTRNSWTVDVPPTSPAFYRFFFSIFFLHHTPTPPQCLYNNNNNNIT